MASNLEFVPFKDFVESLPARTAAKSGDKSIVSNSTDGPGSETDATQAQKVIVGNIAQEFDPNKTSSDSYLPNQCVAYGGKNYVFKKEHYGAWSFADVYEYPVGNVVAEIFGGKSNFKAGFTTSTGYYYHTSVGNYVGTGSIVSGTGKYTPFGGDASSPVGIDISGFVGGTLKITRTTGNVGVRNSAITDSTNIVLVVAKGSDYIDNGDGTCTATIAIPDGSKYLYWSASSEVDLVSLEVVMTKLGVEPRIEKIEKNVPFTRSLEMTTTYENISIDVEGPACGFTKSLSKKVSGVGGARVVINVPIQKYECGSIGIYFPWESQKVAQVYVYYGDISQTALLRANYKSAATGWVFYQQGNGFMRVNFPKGTKKLQLRIDTTDHDTDPWEFYVSDNFVFNDDLPLAPVCIMYDGGAWEGTVIDDGVEMSLWQLHKKYNIPYGICVTEETYNLLNPEVAQDIANGFAHIVLRSADLIPYYNDEQDTQMAEVLNDAFTDICADSRMLVLAEHKLDKKIYRVAVQCGVELVRTGPSNNFINTFGQKFGDSNLFCVPSGRLGGVGGGEIQNYPIILWEHGVGIPPEGWTGLNYVDPTGENTPLLFQWLHGLMEQGKAACLSPSDFIAYCKSH